MHDQLVLKQSGHFSARALGEPEYGGGVIDRLLTVAYIDTVVPFQLFISRCARNVQRSSTRNPW
jgi:hypothetical protein